MYALLSRDRSNNPIARLARQRVMLHCLLYLLMYATTYYLLLTTYYLLLTTYYLLPAHVRHRLRSRTLRSLTLTLTSTS